MPKPVTPWGRKILEVLADGDWHPVDDVIRRAMPTVPPGIAYRTGENERRKLRGRRTAAPDVRTRGDNQTSISTGARERARDCLWSFTRTNQGRTPAVERAVVDGVDSVRLIPPATLDQTG